MARAKNNRKIKKQTVRGRRRTAGPAILIAFLLAVGGIFGWMAACAHITRLKHADLYLQDL